MSTKKYEVLKRIDDTFGIVEWMIGVKKSWNKLRKELEERFPKEQGYIILIGVDK